MLKIKCYTNKFYGISIKNLNSKFNNGYEALILLKKDGIL